MGWVAFTRRLVPLPSALPPCTTSCNALFQQISLKDSICLPKTQSYPQQLSLGPLVFTLWYLFGGSQVSNIVNTYISVR
ncbi:hypothetical protein Plhal703r1_c09g0047661 [Plasmopara halstedii]